MFTVADVVPPPGRETLIVAAPGAIPLGISRLICFTDAYTPNSRASRAVPALSVIVTVTPPKDVLGFVAVVSPVRPVMP
jgi:hypothetical protein